MSFGLYFDTTDSENSIADSSSCYIRGEYTVIDTTAYSDIVVHGATKDNTWGGFIIRGKDTKYSEDETDIFSVNFDSGIVANSTVEINALPGQYSFIARGGKTHIYSNDSTSNAVLEFSADGTQIGKIWGVNRDIELDCDDGYNVKLKKVRLSDLTSNGFVKTMNNGVLFVDSTSSMFLQGVTGIYGQTGIQGVTGIYGQTGLSGGCGVTGATVNYVPQFIETKVLGNSKIYFVDSTTFIADVFAANEYQTAISAKGLGFYVDSTDSNIYIRDDSRAFSNGIVIYYKGTGSDMQTPIGISPRPVDGGALDPEDSYGHGAFTICSDGTDLYALRSDGSRSKMTGTWI